MKITKFALVTFLALAGSAFFQSAKAGMVPFPQDGDLFMGFHSSMATQEYLWDIGQYTQFDGKNVGYHVVLTPNIGADLATVFGGSWATDIHVQWGSVGTLDASSILFATKAEAAIGTFALPWLRQSSSAQSNTGSTIDTMAFGDYAGQTATANNPAGVIHPASDSNPSWAVNNPIGVSFGTWVPTVEAPVTPGSGTGIVNTRLDFFHIDPDNTGTNPPSTYIGSLSIDTLGNVSFDVFDTAPRPIVTTGAATDITKTSATLNGIVNPNGSDTTYQFEYGKTTSYGSKTPDPPADAGNGTAGNPFSADVTGLAAGTLYHFRITATNTVGTSMGADATFTTESVSGTPTPTPTSTPTPSATPTPTVSPTPSVSPTPTPSPTPPLNGSLANISTRLNVGIGDNVLIGGFIITTDAAKKAAVAPKNVVILAVGPSLPVPGALADPVLTLYDGTGTAIATNDDWRTNTNVQAIIDSTLAPTNDKEAALLLPLQPGLYTAIVEGAGGTTGVSIVEIYDLDGDATSKLANISTRGFVQTGDNVMIGGVIVTGDSAANTLVRAIGPTLPLPNALLDPSLEIYNGSGVLMFTNDDWKSDQQTEIEATGLAPTNDKEAAILTTLSPGLYTAIVRGVKGTTGNALVEVYRLNP